MSSNWWTTRRPLRCLVFNSACNAMAERARIRSAMSLLLEASRSPSKGEAKAKSFKRPAPQSGKTKVGKLCTSFGGENQPHRCQSNAASKPIPAAQASSGAKPKTVAVEGFISPRQKPRSWSERNKGIDVSLNLARGRPHAPDKQSHVTHPRYLSSVDVFQIAMRNVGHISRSIR